MKAAVCHEFGQPLVIEDIPEPSPGPGQVLVSIAACAICHSDVLFMEGAWGGCLPAVYGHEAAGYVSEVGPGVSNYAPGDAVLVTLIRSCGSCGSCDSGYPSTCETPYDRFLDSPLRTHDDRVIEHGLSTGAFAEKALVHASQLHPLPPDIDIRVASLLSCGVITGFGAVMNGGRTRPGSTVAVVGTGGVGLNSVQGAAVCGATKIIAVDIDRSRLEVARSFGATHGVIASDKTHREIRELTSGRGVDSAFVTVGSVSAYQQAQKCLAARGEVVAVGMPPVNDTATWSPMSLAFFGNAIRGSKMGETILTRDIPALLDLYRQNRLKLDELVTKYYPLNEINEAVAAMHRGHVLRNVITF
ncbi:MAG: alcohol dehydrogenase catalytic domain-containing protein [Rhodobacteraceae bacterium]|nr:alcohol dehydrogenase catalytic domain-containing protein [Paracoccaceae bacterium]